MVEPLAHRLLEIIIRPAESRVAVDDEIILLLEQAGIRMSAREMQQAYKTAQEKKAKSGQE